MVFSQLSCPFGKGDPNARCERRSSLLLGDVEAAMDALVRQDADDALLETIKVKNTSDFSEDFDVLLSSGHMRRGAGAYRQTCNPSSFPVERSADAPPVGSGCFKPYPPPVTRFKCEVHMKGSEYYTLDATPMVGPDAEYCASVGFTDRSICPLRPEDAPDRVACEQWRVGKAKDTGRPGPTWTKADGSYCTGPASGCANHPDNQFQLWAYARTLVASPA